MANKKRLHPVKDTALVEAIKKALNERVEIQIKGQRLSGRAYDVLAKRLIRGLIVSPNPQLTKMILEYVIGKPPIQSLPVDDKPAITRSVIGSSDDGIDDARSPACKRRGRAKPKAKEVKLGGHANILEEKGGLNGEVREKDDSEED